MTNLRFFVVFCGLLMAFSPIYSQVTVGDNKTPEMFSLLELVSGNNKGLRLPQITSTAQRDAIFTNAAGFSTNPLAVGLQIFNLQTKCVEVWDGTEWNCAGSDWFYLPSFNLDISTPGPKIVDLFNIVDTQLQNSTSGVVASYGYTYPAAGVIKKVATKYVATDLAYVVTYYDNTIINNITIANDGIMSYNVLNTTAGVNSYINIICIVK